MWLNLRDNQIFINLEWRGHYWLKYYRQLPLQFNRFSLYINILQPGKIFPWNFGDVSYSVCSPISGFLSNSAKNMVLIIWFLNTLHPTLTDQSLHKKLLMANNSTSNVNFSFPSLNLNSSQSPYNWVNIVHMK